MKSSSQQFFTNEACDEYLLTRDQQVFTDEQIAGFSAEVVAIIHKQQAYFSAHPPIAIYRYATQGSQTRDGGVIEHGSSGMTVKLESGQRVSVALVGDHAVYADGSKAQITTGGGKANSNVALVGSRLSNGDEIINTPQGSILTLRRQGVPKAADFLPASEG
jgi:hypothetical protein